MDDPFPTTGRLLGIDPGTVRIGLAVCDTDRHVASPLEIYTRRGDSADAAYFQKVVTEEKIVGLVLGLPISLNNTEGPKAKEGRAFAAWLTSITGLPVAFQDERFTTHYANDMLEQMGVRPKHRRGKLDAIAAQVILQVWMESAALDRTPVGE
ncbi:Holliday junction resolvase RuvX [soil metagenome]